MIRNDFVSNSSSSSFIVSHDDNKFHLLLSNPRVLTLKDYINEFGRRHIFNYWCYSDREMDKIKFIAPPRFSKLFGGNVNMTLPSTAKNYMEEYLSVYKSRPEGAKWDSKEFKSWSERCETLMQKVMDCVYKAVEPEWKNVKFDFEEIDDNYIGDYGDYDNDEDAEHNYDHENCDTMEEFVQEKIEYVEGLMGKNLKFFKVFSNH